MDNRYSICPFTADTVQAYKAMRLEALELERGNFGNSPELEAAFTEEQWLQRVCNPDSACFGLYEEDQLIGITGIVITDPAKPLEAYMTQSYIQKAYRGKGLSRLLYTARMEWARDRGIKRLVIGHKATNLVSRAANQHFGFRYTHSESRNWPDGSTVDMCLYELLPDVRT